MSASALYALALCVPEDVLFWHQSEVTLHLGRSLPELILGSRVLGSMVLSHTRVSEGNQHEPAGLLNWS